MDSSRLGEVADDFGDVDGVQGKVNVVAVETLEVGA